MGTLQAYMDRRKKEGKKNKTVNGALAKVRRVLNLSARLWRDEHGLTRLESTPLIQFLQLHGARRPYPLGWEKQHRLFKALPDCLSRICLFKVSTVCRDGEVCSLQWDWEIDAPELGTSVFLIPGEKVKNREGRLVVLNRVAKSVIECVRGQHPERVFTYYGRPVHSFNSNGWKLVRRKLGMHTGTRLETRLRSPPTCGRRAIGNPENTAWPQERRYHHPLLRAGAHRDGKLGV
jgi:integrase